MLIEFHKLLALKPDEYNEYFYLLILINCINIIIIIHIDWVP